MASNVNVVGGGLSNFQEPRLQQQQQHHCGVPGLSRSGTLPALPESRGEDPRFVDSKEKLKIIWPCPYSYLLNKRTA